jgi:hypothetical protein
MTDYVKSTNFASKDSLAIGNPLKIVKGTEIDAEFNNIATAVATKADLNSPALIGTPTAPTASAGTNTTQVATVAFVGTAVTNERTATATLTNKTLTSPSISSPTMTGTPTAPTASEGTDTTQVATTAFVKTALQAVYPVGSIYINAGVTTNPATLLGFGTWVAFGAGRVMVGLSGSDPLFNALEETGGSKDATVVSHTHTFSGTTVEAGNHQHAVDYPIDCTTFTKQYGSTSGTTDSFCDTNGGVSGIPLSSTAGAHSHTYSGTTASTGSSGTNANLQPYIAVAMWKRTA